MRIVRKFVAYAEIFAILHGNQSAAWLTGEMEYFLSDILQLEMQWPETCQSLSISLNIWGKQYAIKIHQLLGVLVPANRFAVGVYRLELYIFNYDSKIGNSYNCWSDFYILKPF